MSVMTPNDARRYLAGLALANEFELEELRTASVELKLRQVWTLMSAARLFEDPVQRETGVREVRDRWMRLYQAMNA